MPEKTPLVDPLNPKDYKKTFEKLYKKFLDKPNGLDIKAYLKAQGVGEFSNSIKILHTKMTDEDLKNIYRVDKLVLDSDNQDYLILQIVDDAGVAQNFAAFKKSDAGRKHMFELALHMAQLTAKNPAERDRAVQEFVDLQSKKDEAINSVVHQAGNQVDGILKSFNATGGYLSTQTEIENTEARTVLKKKDNNKRETLNNRKLEETEQDAKATGLEVENTDIHKIQTQLKSVQSFYTEYKDKIDDDHDLVRDDGLDSQLVQNRVRAIYSLAGVLAEIKEQEYQKRWNSDKKVKVDKDTDDIIWSAFGKFAKNTKSDLGMKDVLNPLNFFFEPLLPLKVLKRVLFPPKWGNDMKGIQSIYKDQRNGIISPSEAQYETYLLMTGKGKKYKKIKRARKDGYKKLGGGAGAVHSFDVGGRSRAFTMRSGPDGTPFVFDSKSGKYMAIADYLRASDIEPHDREKFLVDAWYKTHGNCEGVTAEVIYDEVACKCRYKMTIDFNKISNRLLYELYLKAHHKIESQTAKARNLGTYRMQILNRWIQEPSLLSDAAVIFGGEGSTEWDPDTGLQTISESQSRAKYFNDILGNTIFDDGGIQRMEVEYQTRRAETQADKANGRLSKTRDQVKLEAFDAVFKTKRKYSVAFASLNGLGDLSPNPQHFLNALSEQEKLGLTSHFVKDIDKKKGTWETVSNAMSSKGYVGGFRLLENKAKQIDPALGEGVSTVLGIVETGLNFAPPAMRLYAGWKALTAVWKLGGNTISAAFGSGEFKDIFKDVGAPLMSGVGFYAGASAIEYAKNPEQIGDLTSRLAKVGNGMNIELGEKRQEEREDKVNMHSVTKDIMHDMDTESLMNDVFSDTSLSDLVGNGVLTVDATSGTISIDPEKLRDPKFTQTKQFLEELNKRPDADQMFSLMANCMGHTLSGLFPGTTIDTLINEYGLGDETIGELIQRYKKREKPMEWFAEHLGNEKDGAAESRLMLSREQQLLYHYLPEAAREIKKAHLYFASVQATKLSIGGARGGKDMLKKFKRDNSSLVVPDERMDEVFSRLTTVTDENGVTARERLVDYLRTFVDADPTGGLDTAHVDDFFSILLSVYTDPTAPVAPPMTVETFPAMVPFTDIDGTSTSGTQRIDVSTDASTLVRTKLTTDTSVTPEMLLKREVFDPATGDFTTQEFVRDPATGAIIPSALVSGNSGGSSVDVPWWTYDTPFVGGGISSTHGYESSLAGFFHTISDTLPTPSLTLDVSHIGRDPAQTPGSGTPGALAEPGLILNASQMSSASWPTP